VPKGDLNCCDLSCLKASHWRAEALLAQKRQTIFDGFGMRYRVKAMALAALQPFIGVGVFSDEWPAH
jgi:hypothetical protein